MDSVGRVLLAEDDAHLSRAVAANLRAHGWRVDAVSTGRAAVDTAGSGAHDVVLLDMRLPDMSGLAVLAELRQRRALTPVVLISGYLDVNATLEAMRHGAVEILEKPVEPAHLLQVLRTAVAVPGAAAHAGSTVTELVGRSPAMQRLREQTARVAAFPQLPVLIIGESGTGKELVARAIHRLGRAPDSLVAINCAAVPETLFESELFGHTAGAFSGATGMREGLIESAGQGSILLDEIGEMPAPLQAKLLRVLETRQFRRLGSNTNLPLRARIISATNRMLRGQEGESLRPDLFFRLAGFTVYTPPLRDRLEDLPDLVMTFLQLFAKTHGCTATAVSPEGMAALAGHRWPGNVRELRAVLQSAVVRSTGPTIGVRQVVQALYAHAHRSPSQAPSSAREHPVGGDAREVHESGVVARRELPESLPDLERELVLRVTQECNGNLSQASRRLSIPRSTLRDKLRRYGRG